MNTVMATTMLLLTAANGPAAETRVLRALLIDGQNNHQWQVTTPLIRAALEASGRFTVSVATTPPKNAAAEAWAEFKPDYAAYDVVVSNFTDFGAKACPTEWLQRLCDWVKAGGAFVAVHAGGSGLYHFPEFARLVGMGWANADQGDHLSLDAHGQPVRTPKGQGAGTSHGAPHRFPLTLWSPEHPICAGLPQVWLHARDELWEGTRGPADGLEILATAYGAKSHVPEPFLWTVKYGQGRVFVTVLGHDEQAMRCVGFRTTLARGAEWAATGAVRQAVPADFPREDQVSLAP